MDRKNVIHELHEATSDWKDNFVLVRLASLAAAMVCAASILLIITIGFQ